MTIKTPSTVVRARIYAQITKGGDGGTRIKTHFPNAPKPVKWTGSAKVAELAEPDESWIHLSVLPAESSQSELGNRSLNKDRSSGIVMVMVHTPVGTGDDAAGTICGRIEKVLRGYINGVTFRKATSGNPRTEGAWYIVNTTAPYYFDHNP